METMEFVDTFVISKDVTLAEQESSQQQITDVPMLEAAKEDYSGSSHTSQSFVQGLPEQICETDEILKEISSLYTHILSNEFKGGANGKIGQEEAMVCDCTPDLCKLFTRAHLFNSPGSATFCVWI
jgi:hypothetical protein